MSVKVKLNYNGLLFTAWLPLPFLQCYFSFSTLGIFLQHIVGMILFLVITLSFLEEDKSLIQYRNGDIETLDPETLLLRRSTVAKLACGSAHVQHE